MTEHTAGPWEATHFCKEDGEPIKTVEDVIETMGVSARKSGGPILHGVTTEGTDFLTICYTGNGPKGLVNANLIAAAPDLLDALDRLYHAVHAFDIPEEFLTVDVACDAAEAAIAKATGQA